MWTDGTTTYVNASTCDIKYNPGNLPIIFDLPRDRESAETFRRLESMDGMAAMRFEGSGAELRLASTSNLNAITEIDIQHLNQCS